MFTNVEGRPVICRPTGNFCFLSLQDLYKSNSNRLIFSFPLSHLIGESPITILVYWGDVLQQIDFYVSSLIHEWPETSHACESCG